MSEIKKMMRVRIKTAPTHEQVEMDERGSGGSEWPCGCADGMQHMAGVLGVVVLEEGESCIVRADGHDSFWWEKSNLEIVE